MPRPQPWGLCVLPLLLLLPPQTPRAGEGRPAGRRAGRGRPLGKEHTKHNPYFPRAALPPSPRVHALLSRSPPPLGVSGKHLFPCLQVPVPLSLRLPPLSGSVPFFWGGVLSPSILSLLHPVSVLCVPSCSLHLCVSPADGNRSLLYHLTCVSSPAPGTPAFWVSGWLGPQQYLSYNNLRGQAEPYGAWVWESPVSWYWEKETTDLRQKQKLFLEALSVLKKGGEISIPEPEGGERGAEALGLSEERSGPCSPVRGTPGSYTLQGLLGCELGPDNVSVPVARFALNGEDFMTFDPKTGIWDGDWPESATIGQKWKQQKEVVNKEKTFLLYSCPQRLLGHLERGRGNLEWKGEQPPEGPLVSCTSLSHGPMVGPGFFPQPRLWGLGFQSASRSSSPMGPRRSLHPQSRPCPSLAHSPRVAPRAPRTQLKPPSMAWPPPPPQPHFSPPASLS